MPEPIVYRVTKYDPADRNERGYYVGTLDSACDEGPIEAAYLEALAAFARAAGVERLTVREPELGGSVHFGLGPRLPGGGLADLFAEPTDFHDGAEVSLATGIELVRVMLRESGGWCRLEVADRFFVHVGYDQYLYVGTAGPIRPGVERARELGLYPERIDESPYAPEPDGSARELPADASYWARLRDAVADGRVRLLEERSAMTRWHWLRSPGAVDAVRARLVPRARLTAWPDLFTVGPAAVLSGLDPEEHHRLLCELPDGRLATDWFDLQDPADLAVLAAAHSVALVPEESTALPDAVLPDADGVVRVRG
ncbi:RNA-binding protein [Kitasatospora sp. NPDC096147]|uniref:RNA-binding protein n=1 Tax=Kitasatospora sp. NPDC096147 TaxID=3364093 RepID=UPI00381B421E